MISDLFENRFKLAGFSMPDPPTGGGGEEEEDDDDKTTGTG